MNFLVFLLCFVYGLVLGYLSARYLHWYLYIYSYDCLYSYCLRKSIKQGRPVDDTAKCLARRVATKYGKIISFSVGMTVTIFLSIIGADFITAFFGIN